MAGFDVVPATGPRLEVAGTGNRSPDSRSRGMVPLVISKLASALPWRKFTSEAGTNPSMAAPGPTPQGDGQSPKVDKSAYAGGSQPTHRA